MKLYYMASMFFLLASIFSCSSMKEKDTEIFYIKKKTKVVDVYNLTKMWESAEDISYLENPNYDYGEFGGGISFCSNENYYCLSGGLNIAIPKKNDGKKIGYMKDACAILMFHCQITR